MSSTHRLLVFALAAVTATVAAKPPAGMQARLDAFVKGQPGGVAVA